jgi:integrase/recombinase XerD
MTSTEQNRAGTSIETAIQEYLKSLKVQNLAARTIKEAAWRLGKFTAYMESRGVAGITGITKEVIVSYRIEQYERINQMGRPNGVRHQNMLLATVKQFTRWLWECDYIVSDPAKDIRYAKQPKSLPRGILTPTEARKILHAPDTKSVIGYRDRTILEILYTSGIRKDELVRLTLDDVDYNDGFLRVFGKGRKERMVPLGRIACRYLENYIKSVRPELIRDPYEKTVFLSLRHRPLSKNMVWELTKRHAKKAKIPKNVHPHTFRHTCATQMLRNKAHIRAVQELLGHSSLDSTQVYTHVSITDLKEIHKSCHPREKDKE